MTGQARARACALALGCGLLLAVLAVPASAVLPPKVDSPPTKAERARLSHLIAAHFPAAWNARSLAREGDVPVVLIADEYGNGSPSRFENNLDAVTFGPGIDPLGPFTPSNHGYHVTGIVFGSWANDGSGPGIITGAAGVPGAFYPHDIIDGPSLRSDLTGFANLVNSISDHVVINTSRGSGDALASEAVEWINAVRGHSLEARVFHATSAGNDSSKQAVEGSPFSAAALNPNLQDGQTPVPPLTNTLVAENVKEKADASALECLNGSSSSGGSIAAPGRDVWSLNKNGGAFNDTGTSMSAPVVAGLATYLWSIDDNLTPQDLVSAITMNPQPPPDGCERTSAPMVDAYAATLSVDAATAPTLAGYPVRLAILDVANPKGTFDGDDLKQIFSKIDEDLPARNRDFSRYDLNGDGYTGGTHKAPFDLDRSTSTYAGQTETDETATISFGNGDVDFEEEKTTDLDILCFYAHSPLYTGTDNARAKPCLQVEVSPDEITVAPRRKVQFSAKVLGASNQKVTWSETCGSVNQRGLYTAPREMGTCKVTATSELNPDRKDSAKVTVKRIQNLVSMFAGTGPCCPTTYCYVNPTDLTISPGEAVTWKNTVAGEIARAIVLRQDFTSEFASDELATGETASHTFTTAGTYRHACSVPGRYGPLGTITVGP